jgi:antitoxin-like ribbon-helix-helix protein
MSKQGKFGGDAYKPKQLGPEPANPSTDEPTQAESPPVDTSPKSTPSGTNTTDAKVAAEIAALRSVKVPFSSRITVAADQQLKAMAREGRSQTELLAEALNLLFKKHGRNQVA